MRSNPCPDRLQQPLSITQRDLELFEIDLGELRQRPASMAFSANSGSET
jgi:hypothetical protein